MSDEYEYGPWIEVPSNSVIEFTEPVYNVRAGTNLRYRIATPKPKREFVVGKWYYDEAADCWLRCILLHTLDKRCAWLAIDDEAWLMSAQDVDWSTPPRDEAPE